MVENKTSASFKRTILSLGRGTVRTVLAPDTLDAGTPRAAVFTKKHESRRSGSASDRRQVISRSGPRFHVCSILK